MRAQEVPGETLFAAAEAQESKDAEYVQFLKAADDLIDQSRLGGYGSFLSPFSHQFKVSIRGSYPLEVAAFDETDKNQEQAIDSAMRMRSYTFFLFSIYTALILVLLSDSSAIMSRNHPLIVPASLVVASILLILRYLIRRDMLSSIGGDATRFSNYFFKALTRIHDQAINAVHLSTEDLMMTPSWPERSAGWIKIALWHSKRYENLDRYVTATAWKIESRYLQIERGFRTLKLLVLALVLAATGEAVLNMLGRSNIDPVAAANTIAATLLYAFIVVFFWGLRTKVSNAYWGQRFRESIVGFDEQKEHIHNQIAKVIAADKKYYMGGQKNVGKEKGP